MTLTALKLFATNTADATLPNANTIVVTTGAPATPNVATKCGNVSTGFGLMFAQGDASGWGNAGVGFAGIQVPNSKGFLLPKATLDLNGQQIPAGAWTVRLRLKTSVGTLTADLFCPHYVFNTVTGTFAPIGAVTTLTLAAQTITSAAANFDFAAIALPAQNFGGNMLVYFEPWLNITANNTGNAAATVSIGVNSSATIGNTSSCRILTPGFQPIPPFGGGSGLQRRGEQRARRN